MDIIKYRDGTWGEYISVWVGSHYVICYVEKEGKTIFGRVKKYLYPVKSVPLDLVASVETKN